MFFDRCYMLICVSKVIFKTVLRHYTQCRWKSKRLSLIENCKKAYKMFYSYKYGKIRSSITLLFIEKSYKSLYRCASFSKGSFDTHIICYNINTLLKTIKRSYCGRTTLHRSVVFYHLLISIYLVLQNK